MVASNTDRLGGRFPSKSTGTRQFAHPLLRIAAQIGDAPQTYRAFHRLVRRALDALEFSQKRADLSVEVLDALNSLQLDDKSAGTFRHEWLQSVTKSSDSATLYEALAMEEMSQAGLTLPVGVWRVGQIRTDGLSAIRLVQADSSNEGVIRRTGLPSAAFRALLCCVDTAFDAHREERLKIWPARDCMAVIRSLALLSVLEPDHQTQRQKEQTQHYYLEMGQGLWTMLAERLSTLPEAESQECLWDGSLQRLVALHAIGRVSVAKLRPKSGGAVTAQPTSSEPLGQGLLRVIHDPVPSATHKEDVETLKMYEPLQLPQPVASMLSHSKVDAVLSALSDEFPWATNVVNELGFMLRARSLFGVQELNLAPVLIVGHPGAGKSRFVRRLAEHLALPYLPMALGGRSDSKLLTGTARGWAGGEPTPLLKLMLQHRTASGLILLDEIDKVGASDRNGAPTTSTLLGLLEPETAARWHDGFLQTTCDFSRLSFWATANSLKTLPSPLLSRFTILYMPEPLPEHMPTLAQGITDDIAREWRLPLGVLPLAPSSVFEGVRLNARELRRSIMRFLSEWAQENRSPSKLH